MSTATLDRDLQAIQDVRDLLHRAKSAQAKLRKLRQEEVDRICYALVQAGVRESRRLAEIAVEESGFGVVESKVMKNHVATEVFWDYIRDLKTCGVIARDEAKGVIEIAEPAGVVGGLIPITNPTSTTLFKIICALKARCAIIVSPHPRGTRCTGETCRVLYEAAVRAGAPEGCIGCMQIITMDAAAYLMENCDLILATGGLDLVKAAYSAGRPALGVGPGNPPAYIHASADIARAVKAIVMSQTFDNATICSSEQSIVCDASIRDRVQAELKRQGCHLTTPEETAKLERIVVKGRRQNPDIVGQYPRTIAQMAGFTVPHDTTVLVCDQTGKGVGFDFPLSIEKLAPILAFYAEPDLPAVTDRCRKLLEFGGDGHTMAIHTRDERVIMDLAFDLPASRILINSPTSQGGVGFSTNLVPSMTLGCGTAGHNITTDNISPLHLVNVKRIAFVKPGFVESNAARPQAGAPAPAWSAVEPPRTGLAPSPEAGRTVRFGPQTALFADATPLGTKEIEEILAKGLQSK